MCRWYGCGAHAVTTYRWPACARCAPKVGPTTLRRPVLGGAVALRLDSSSIVPALGGSSG